MVLFQSPWRGLRVGDKSRQALISRKWQVNRYIIWTLNLKTKTLSSMFRIVKQGTLVRILGDFLARDGSWRRRWSNRRDFRLTDSSRYKFQTSLFPNFWIGWRTSSISVKRVDLPGENRNRIEKYIKIFDHLQSPSKTWVMSPENAWALRTLPGWIS